MPRATRYSALRRGVLRAGVALGATIALPPSFPSSAAQPRKAPALVPRRLYFVRADYVNVRVSPDGNHLSYLAPVNGVLNLFIAPVSAPRAARQLTQVTDRDIGWRYEWAHNNRHIVFFQDRDGDENWRASSVDIASGAVKLLTPERGVRTQIQEVSHLYPDEMLVRLNARDRGRFDLHRINVVTGDSSLVHENRDFAWFMTDSTFKVRLGARYAASGDLEIVQRTADGWAPFMTMALEDVESSTFIDIGGDGRTLYLADSRGRDKAALVALDMTSAKATVLAQDRDADIVRVQLDHRTRKPLAAAAVKDRVRWQGLDAASRRELERFSDAGRGDLEILSRSLDGDKVTAYYERDDASGEYALYERSTGRVRKLYRARAALDTAGLRPMQPVAIRARDGLTLNSYLTLPARDARRVPLVLVIHGGPYWRDSWGYSGVHQFLANRGYAVLSINFRGSTGFGKAFVSAADRQWGARMHDDLIDGLDWAIEQGYADPQRVGFYGASYGGYSALTAATRTPERFACIVDIFGISNLLTFMATIPEYWKPWFSVWKTRVGNPDTEEGREFLRSRSPLYNLERATKPILIAQGMRDVRVVAAESEQMVAALKKNGAPVTYVTFPDEGHGFVRNENRLAFYAVVEAFFARHLGGRYQPVGGDFAGSSIKIETGGELIPGLPEARAT
jgi:dipeptidyl aminopeptidase/acylaminoacyl peptidase